MTDATTISRDDVTRQRQPPIALAPSAFRALGHQLVDQLAGLLDAVPEGPVTRERTPSEIRLALDLGAPCPRRESRRDR